MAEATLSERFQRGDLLSPDCPSRAVLKHVTSQWGFLIMIALETRTLRFSELRRIVAGVSERMLSQALRNLEQDGLVARVAFEVVPPHVEYSLTPLGVGAAQKVRVLADWIESNLPVIADGWNASGEDETALCGEV